jgi:RNA polymerase sigma-70 factor (ECF subfamily)
VRRAGEFEELRPLLFSITYRILGSVSEAEDAVQETWLRYAASPAQLASAKAFLSAVVTRISINVLRSARYRREEYVGPWFPEPLIEDPFYPDRRRRGAAPGERPAGCDLPRPGRQGRQHLGP